MGDWNLQDWKLTDWNLEDWNLTDCKMKIKCYRDLAVTRSHERRTRQVQLKTVANTSRANHRSRNGYLSRSERR